MLEEIYCSVDDFHKKYSPVIEKYLITSGARKRYRPSQLSMPEIITIMILFHQSHYRNFKHFYLNHVHKYLKNAFPKLVSYNRFIELQPRSLIYITLLSKMYQPKETGFYFIDSTPIEVCHIVNPIYLVSMQS